MRLTFKYLFLLCVVSLSIAGCGGPSTEQLVATAVVATQQAGTVATSVAATQTAEQVCGQTALTTYADAMEAQLDQYASQSSLVGATPRASIGAPLQRLLDIQQETKKIPAPPCVKAYHAKVQRMMDLYRLGYQNFASQGSDIVSTTVLKQGEDMAKTLRPQLAMFRSGKLPETKIAPATQQLWDAYVAAGYPLEIEDAFDNKPALRSEKDNTIIVVSLSPEGAVTEVTINTPTVDQTATAAKIALPEWADAEKWIASNAKSNNATKVIGKATASMGSLTDAVYLTLTFN